MWNKLKFLIFGTSYLKKRVQKIQEEIKLLPEPTSEFWEIEEKKKPILKELESVNSDPEILSIIDRLRPLINRQREILGFK